MSVQDMRGASVRPDLVDRLLALYCEWRTECSAVHAAYEGFSRAQASEREAAFLAYGAALDREGAAAARYGAQVRLVAALARGSDPPRRVRIGRRR